MPTSNVYTATVTATEDQWRNAAAMLAEGPYKLVAPIIDQVRMQIIKAKSDAARKAMADAQAAPAPVPADVVTQPDPAAQDDGDATQSDPAAQPAQG